VLGGTASLYVAAHGGAAAWVVPTYRNSRPLWRLATRAVRPMEAAGLCKVQKAERVIEFRGGGWLGVYTADNAGSILGDAFDLVVLDEAARYYEGVWSEVIQPTLADRNGRAIMISTPRGRNWFWHEWQRGKSDDVPEYASWRLPSADNPNPWIRRAAELARARVPDMVYRQEWLAEFISDGGAVFRHVRDRVSAVAGPVEGHHYVVGADWGKLNDFTVLTVVDLTERAVVEIDRFNQIDYVMQRGRLVALCERYEPLSVIAERNAMGEPIIEELLREGLPVRGFTTTNASKAQAIEGLALAFERGTITIPDDDTLTGELLAFTATRLPSGLLRYEAPAGLHDDCVMSLALAWTGVGSVVEGRLMA